MRTGLAYRLLVRAGVALAPRAARGRPKLQEGLAGRTGLLERLEAWGRSTRDPARPLLWLHAASAGESLQAEPVLRRLRSAHTDWQIAFTCFSPSARSLAQQLGADISDYLPLDLPGHVERALAALRPAALVFSKLDLWPELATRAAARGSSVGMIGATVSPHARRLRWPARVLLRPGYLSLTAVGAVAADDRDRLIRLGVPAERIELTGDPRCDGALERAAAIHPGDPVLAPLARGPVLVAGSTWPEDEEALLDAFQVVIRSSATARLVLVPHEPTSGRLQQLDESARRRGLAPVRLDDPDAESARLIVVDRTGILARLYGAAALAWVGGGYGRRLHSVLEPAACGVPVLFGPDWRGSPDAGALLGARAAAAAEDGYPDWLDLDAGTTFADVSPLAALWLALLRHPEHRQAAGARARRAVEAGAGAAARSAALIERLVAG